MSKINRERAPLKYCCLTKKQNRASHIMTVNFDSISSRFFLKMLASLKSQKPTTKECKLSISVFVSLAIMGTRDRL